MDARQDNADEPYARLVELIATGDMDAVGPLYDSIAPQVYGLALRALRDPSLAEDAVQDTFVAIWRNAGRFDRTRGSAKAWLLTIARNRAIDAVRRRRPVTSLPETETAQGNASATWWMDDDRFANRSMLADGLAKLPPAQRTAIQLSFVQGMTHQQIALHTGAPLGTVKSRVRIGLSRLRDHCSVT
ncbi:MAG TPA: sigma-70 family RNA polymerase sigma factor [Candidatus Limnocylindrales bacterium]|nr:sigma-70 family RNA polymerase sigma factor [Candidatus Limnocylindrales bacterium]